MRRHSKALVAAFTLLAALWGVGNALAAPPVVTIAAPSDVSFSSVKGHGSIDPGENEVSYHFELVEQANFEASGFELAEWKAFGSVLAEQGPTEITRNLGGLAPGTTYHIRLAAEVGSETFYATLPQSFTTVSVTAPTASGFTAVKDGAHGATFEAMVGSGGTGPGQETSYRIQCSPECGALVGGRGTVPTDGQPHPVHAEAKFLSAGTSYEVFLEVFNAISAPPVQASFSTDTAPPVIVGIGIGARSEDSAQVNARIDANSAEVTNCTLEYGPTTAYGSSAPCLSDVLSETPLAANPSPGTIPVAALLHGLTTGATYHYRLVLATTIGSASSTDATLTTVRPATECAAVGQCAGAGGRRTIELVSNVNKGQLPVNGNMQLSNSGERILYRTQGPAPGSGNGGPSWYLADRVAGSGWVNHDPLPSLGSADGVGYADLLANRDLSGLLTYSSFPGVLSPTPITYFRVHADSGSAEKLHRFELDDYKEEAQEIAGDPSVAASEDLSHVFVNSPEDIANEDTNGAYDVYDVGVNPPAIVDRLPDGSIPSCGTTRANESGFARSTVASHADQNWVSRDGSVVFFESRGNTACDKFVDPRQLYRRDLDTGVTISITQPPVAGEDRGVGAPEQPGLLQAAGDGSWVIYRTGSTLDPLDSEDGSDSDYDLYRWTAQGGNECMTCVPGISAELEEDSSQFKMVASGDGTHAYFISEKTLAQGATAEGPKLYVWDRGSIDFIAPSARSGVLSPSSGSTATDLTPDGNVLIFTDFKPNVTATDNGFTLQLYRYDDRSRSVTCMSCPVGRTAGGLQDEFGGSLTQGFSVTAGHVISDDGSTVAFPARGAILPSDGNEGDDLYEWHEGAIGLVTDGLTDGTVILSGISPSGRDLAFSSFVPLAPGLRDTSGQVYDARVGGEVIQRPPERSPCAGESCRSPGAAVTILPPAASATAPSQASAPNKRKPHKKHRHKKHRHKKHSAHTNGKGGH